MPPNEMQWYEITDFKPGIFSRNQEAGVAEIVAPPGAASPTNTYRCMALDSGGLGPLWTRDFTLNYDSLHDGALGGGRQYQVTGFYVPQPVGVANTAREHEFFFGIEWIDTTNRKFRLRRYRLFDTTWDSSLASEDSTTLPSSDQYSNANFVTTRANRAAPTSPGIPVVIIGYAAPGPANPRTIWSFPDDGAPTVSAVDELFGDTLSGSLLISHQGRVVFCETQSYGHGSGSSWLTNDNLVWTVVNDTDTLSSATRAVFGSDNPGPYACGISMSANELFLVKKFGGAVQVIGDLDDPTVYNLPNVASGFGCIPAFTPIGVVYLGSSGGVYAWNGGDQAQPISRQLDDWFFKVSGSVMIDHQAGLCMVGTDYVALPRLWIYNVHLKSWWRLDNESDLRQHAWIMQSGYANARAPFLYAAMIEFNATDVPVVYGWDCDIPASDFSWQSHPIWLSRNRDITVREVVVEAIGSGVVTISLTDRHGNTTAKDFVVSDTSHATRIRQDFSVTGQNLVLRIQSDSNTTGPAPIVHGLRMGYIDSSQVGA